MTTINLAAQEQHGGFYALQIFSTEEIVSSPEILTNKNASQMVLQPSEDSLDIPQLAESLKVSEPQAVTKSGVLYNISGSFEIPLQTSEIDDFLKSFLTKKVILIGVKHFNQQKIYGSKLHPLRLKYEMANGTKQEEASIIKVKIYGKIPQKPVFLVG